MHVCVEQSRLEAPLEYTSNSSLRRIREQAVLHKRDAVFNPFYVLLRLMSHPQRYVRRAMFSLIGSIILLLRLG